MSVIIPSSLPDNFWINWLTSRSLMKTESQAGNGCYTYFKKGKHYHQFRHCCLSEKAYGRALLIISTAKSVSNEIEKQGNYKALFLLFVVFYIWLKNNFCWKTTQKRFYLSHVRSAEQLKDSAVRNKKNFCRIFYQIS